MRKIILSMMVSLDGYIEGTNNDIHWHVWDDKMEDYMMDFFQTVDTFIYGRKSYELMLGYWSGQTGAFADMMNKTPKIVFTKTLEKVEWNSKIVSKNVVEEINMEKNKKGRDLVLFAGAGIASTFIMHDLIDEYRLIINPVVLGKGTSLFPDKKRLKLKLLEAKAFDCGNTLLIYKPEKRIKSSQL
ncbi:dihydrofolate reductase [Gillisia sp. Hel_I_86]|uniref:dihydrofolate reductase family protein n=1 Tax=Gillisia sp. Hel_I_86 TaxID=1249981 RepID=UPI00119A8BC6|nr:dihydrofolate reductase family protein [Gillisia sp. Hel_I_86]TVZ26926.1 dihydrofolate reductase [Gillisia sp. Hel_I_86]